MAFSRISSPIGPAPRPLRWARAASLLAASWTSLVASTTAQHRSPDVARAPRQALLLAVTSDPAAEPSTPGGIPEQAWFRTPLQHLGIEPLPHLINPSTLPTYAAALPEAPILLWIGGGATVPAWLPGWLLERAERQRVVLLGDPDRLDAADPTAAARLWRHLGFEPRAGFVDDPLRIELVLHDPVDPWFESPPRRSPLHRGTRSLGGDHRVWVHTVDRLEQAHGQPDRRDHVVTGAFGGLARQPFLLEPGDARLAPRWHLDPLRFFAAALGLDDTPIPDPHVVHGRRALHLSIGSEGLLGRSTIDVDRLNADVLLERLLDVHRVPVTVSIDASSVRGLAATERDDLVQSLRRLADRPFVEFALECPTLGETGDDGLAAPQPDERQRTAALDAAHRSLEACLGVEVATATWRLAPANDDDLRRLADWSRCLLQLGLTPIPVTPFRRDLLSPSLLDVPPLGWTSAEGVPLAALRAPIEALYPRFYGELPGAYRHAETTLLRTDPARFRIAAALRGQFHSAERPARLAALDGLLRTWIDEHDTCVVFTGEHLAAVRDVLDPQRCQSVRVGDEGWDFTGFQACRTLRFDESCPPIDWDRSPGVVGARRLGSTLWIELGSADAALRWQDGLRTTPQRPHLEQADRPLRSIRRDAAGISCEFDARTGPPTELIAAGFPADTALRWSIHPGGVARALRSDALGRVRLALQTVWTGDAAGAGVTRRLRIEVMP